MNSMTNYPKQLTAIYGTIAKILSSFSVIMLVSPTKRKAREELRTVLF